VLANSIPFSAEHGPDFFAQFPAAPAVFLLRGAEKNAEPYVGKTTSLKRRLQRLLSPPESQSKRLNLRERAAQIEYTLTGSDFESVLLLYKILRREFPKTYSKRLRLSPSPLVRLNLENSYPRAYVTTRLGRLSSQSLYYGPFRSRAVAERFLNDSLDLFKMRRCSFELNPDPAYPGCVYSEMKMCLAPCFKGCSDEEYAAEVKRVQDYFDSGGDSLIHELEEERNRFSESLDFEAAAQRHTKITKIKGILAAIDDICRRLEILDALIVQPCAEEKSVALFRFFQGQLAGPVHFQVELEGDQGPMDSRLREAAERLGSEGGTRSATQFSEELSLLKRWYYRSHKKGEIFPGKKQGELPFRKIANGIERVYRGEQLPTPQPLPENSESVPN